MHFQWFTLESEREDFKASGAGGDACERSPKDVQIELANSAAGSAAASCRAITGWMSRGALPVVTATIRPSGDPKASGRTRQAVPPWSGMAHAWSERQYVPREAGKRIIS